MLAALVVGLCAGQLSFDAQPLDDFATFMYVENVDHIDISQSQHDVDSDGHIDLELASGVVAFQRDGRFPESAWIELPVVPEGGRRVVWHNRIFMFRPDGLTVLSWSEEGWAELSNQALTWPDSNLGQVHVRDLDGDGTAEFLWFSSRDVLVFAERDGAYKQVATWNLGDALQRVRVESSPVFPTEKRKAFGVSLVTSYEMRISDGHVSIGQWHEDNGQSRYEVERIPINMTDLILDESNSQRWQSAPIGSEKSAKAFELNEDGDPDFLTINAPTKLDLGRGLPHTEIRVSTDGGAHFMAFKSLFTGQPSPIVDMNRDGRGDVVLHQTLLADGGLREAALRGATRKTIRHRIDVHIQDSDGGFTRPPTHSTEFTITLDKVPMRLSPLFFSYLDGGLISVHGDFNGDGLNDLLYPANANRLVVRLGHSHGFEEDVAAEIHVQDMSWLSIADVNGDGLDDILATPHGQQQIVYFAELVR